MQARRTKTQAFIPHPTARVTVTVQRHETREALEVLGAPRHAPKRAQLAAPVAAMGEVWVEQQAVGHRGSINAEAARLTPVVAEQAV